MSPALGTKRVCPKCDAKFYDFGVVDPIKCPKCGKTWADGAPKKKTAIKPKPEKLAPKPKKRVVDDEEMLDDALPEVADDGDLEDIEPIEDEGVELTSLEEVEEHEEEAEADPNSDDAEDGMFTDMVGEERLVDDFEDHLEDEDEEDEDEEDGEDEDDDDDDSSRRKKRRR